MRDGSAGVGICALRYLPTDFLLRFFFSSLSRCMIGSWIGALASRDTTELEGSLIVLFPSNKMRNENNTT